MVGIAVLMLIGTLWADAEFGSGASAQSLPSQVQVLATITEVNNYWISQNPTPGNSDWTQATYFTGDLAAYDATGQSNYLSFAESWASGHDYSLDGGNTTTYANYQAAGQVYIRLYQLLNNSSYISGITQSINGMVNSNVDNEWTWIDAINMSMPDFAELGSMDANTSYFTKMYALYSYTKYTLGLFDPVTGLWWENSTYANTSTYWSRGNGWVFAAHAKVLSVLPPSDPHYPEYLATFQTMAAALAQRQQPGGYWNADLGGTDYAGPESSGTSFFLYGIAWGLNNGILDQATYLPIAENAWNFLANTAVQPSGLLGYVQPTGSAPGPTTATTTEDFGVGAFLLAARQMELLTAWASGTTYTVSGAITPASLGNGATVTLSQNGITIAATTVQPGGNYSFASVLPGTYTVTPNKSGINFSPTSQSVTVSGGPATVSTFSAQTATITGLALDSSTPAAVKTNTQTLTTASFTPPAGSVLYICVMLNSNASPATDQNYVSQITDNLSTHLTYTLQKQYGTASGNSAIVYLYTASVSTSQAMTVSITQGAADTSISNAMVQVLVITGANASSPVGKTAGAGATTTNISGTDYNSSVNDSWSWLIYADYA
ncbi:MAG: glycoside hydrolase family 88 protein, partial [Thermodesulfovibrionales bacterium]